MLIKLAVEELLRYDGPLETATERYAREDVTIEGMAINTLLRRAPSLRLALDSETLRWYRGLLLRGVTALPVNLS